MKINKAATALLMCAVLWTIFAVSGTGAMSTAFANAIYEVAPLYPDTKFVALDVSEGDLTAYGEREFDGPNVYSAVYQEELAGYMAGYAAVKMGFTKLGFLGGMAVPAVQRYGGGFVQGADAAAAELGKDDVEIKYVYGGQFFGDADITAAMDTWYGKGTEVVFACGGGIYTSAAEAAAKVGGKVIGVDVAQQLTHCSALSRQATGISMQARSRTSALFPRLLLTTTYSCLIPHFGMMDSSRLITRHSLRSSSTEQDQFPQTQRLCRL